MHTIIIKVWFAYHGLSDIIYDHNEHFLCQPVMCPLHINTKKQTNKKALEGKDKNQYPGSKWDY